jgi:hypothetical protein
MLRGRFRPKREGVTGGKACNTFGRDENAYKILIEKPKGKRQFKRR